MPEKVTRRRLLVHPGLQVRLMVHMSAYLLIYSLSISFFGVMLAMITDIATNGMADRSPDIVGEFFRQLKPLLTIFVLLLPIILYQILKLSHRIAGPLYRCRQVMQEMARGNPVPEFMPRKNDLMPEFFQDFNALIKEWNARGTAKKNADELEKNADGLSLRDSADGCHVTIDTLPMAAKKAYEIERAETAPSQKHRDLAKDEYLR